MLLKNFKQLNNNNFIFNSFLKEKNFILKYFLSTNSTFEINQISEIEKKRKQCFYRSKERGMLENDLILGSFAGIYIYTIEI